MVNSKKKSKKNSKVIKIKRIKKVPKINIREEQAIASKKYDEKQIALRSSFKPVPYDLNPQVYQQLKAEEPNQQLVNLSAPPPIAGSGRKKKTKKSKRQAKLKSKKKTKSKSKKKTKSKKKNKSKKRKVKKHLVPEARMSMATVYPSNALTPESLINKFDQKEAELRASLKAVPYNFSDLGYNAAIQREIASPIRGRTIEIEPQRGVLIKDTEIKDTEVRDRDKKVINTGTMTDKYTEIRDKDKKIINTGTMTDKETVGEKAIKEASTMADAVEQLIKYSDYINKHYIGKIEYHELKLIQDEKQKIIERSGLTSISMLLGYIHKLEQDLRNLEEVQEHPVLRRTTMMTLPRSSSSSSSSASSSSSPLSDLRIEYIEDEIARTVASPPILQGTPPELAREAAHAASTAIHDLPHHSPPPVIVSTAAKAAAKVIKKEAEVVRAAVKLFDDAIDIVRSETKSKPHEDFERSQLEHIIRSIKISSLKERAQHILNLWMEGKDHHRVADFDTMKELFENFITLDHFYNNQYKSNRRAKNRIDELFDFPIKGSSAKYPTASVIFVKNGDIIRFIRETEEMERREAEEMQGSGKYKKSSYKIKYILGGKSYHIHIKGGDILNVANERPQIIHKTLEKYGDWIILQLKIVRTPLNIIWEKLANIATLGKFNKFKLSNNIDNYFHLFSEMVLKDPHTGHIKPLLLEKNELVDIKDVLGNSRLKNEEVLNIPLHKRITLEQYLRNGERYAKDHNECPFYVYDATNCNCQLFQRTLLKGNGLWKPQYERFIVQDVESAIPRWLSKFVKGTTNLAAKLRKRIYK
jgi:hypothetical protein